MRAPQLVIEGIPFPVSVHPDVSGDRLRYAKPPTSSLDWQGADWLYPTALTFATHVARAEITGRVVTIHQPYGADQDAEAAFMIAREGLRDLAFGVKQADMLVDRKERIRVRFMEGKISFRTKVWPAIAGVTYYAEDSTI